MRARNGGSALEAVILFTGYTQIEGRLMSHMAPAGLKKICSINPKDMHFGGNANTLWLLSCDYSMLPDPRLPKSYES